MIEARIVDDPAEWNSLVERSEQASPFHRYESLSVVAEYSGGELLPYVAVKGEEPVGIFPVYSLSRGPFRTAVSPPPALEVNYLGPAQLPAHGAKQRKAEKRHRRFVEAVLDDVDERIDPHYVYVRTGLGYDDPRPLIWNDFEATPRYTYSVDLTRDADDLFMSFSSDLRRNVKRGRENDGIVIGEGDVEDVGRIVRRTKARHEEQGVAYSVPPAFVQDLYRSLPDEAMAVYTLTDGDEFLGGVLTLEDESTVYRWQSVADLESDVPVADILDWELIQRSIDRGRTRLDLVGANNPRLCGYKAKFNPAVETFYSLERSTRSFDVAKLGYFWLRERRGK